uniref:uncharacterized protein LOC101302145 n=1 Tax=Fragaria vesca subsp. vesca TaxID=101020 RepID=UPI0005CB0C1F
TQFSGDAGFRRSIHAGLLQLIHGCRLFIDPWGFDLVPITFKLYHQTATYSGDEFQQEASDTCYGECNWVTERRFQVPVSNFQRAAYARIITGYLKTLRVPEDNHAAFIQEIFRVILRAVPGIPISVRIVRFTRQVAPKGFTSYIKGLEEVRVHSLEEASTENTPCAICTEDLDPFRGEIDNDDDEQIIRLPCLHLYHRDCIVPWLKRCLVCPLCRHSMSLVKVKRTSTRRCWPSLFNISSGGVITAMRILTSHALPPVLYMYFMKRRLSHLK